MTWLVLTCGLVLGQAAAPAAENPPADLLENVTGLSGVLESLIREHLPDHYENRKQWGQTKEIWSGLKVSLDGLRIDSEPRHKRVNHGTWKRYRVDLAQPADRLALSVENVHETDAHQLHFDVVTIVPLHLTGQVAHWDRGLKLASVSGDADATVRFRAGLDLSIDFEFAKLPPDVLLRPSVTDARVELVDFRLRRISQFEGPLMKLLGEGLEDSVADKLADTNRTLAAKLNRQIEKKHDKLRLSAADWLAKKLGPSK